MICVENLRTKFSHPEDGAQLVDKYLIFDEKGPEIAKCPRF